MLKRFPHKKFRYAGITVAILFVGFIIVGEGLSYHYKNLIRSRLDVLSAKATDSLYHISIEGIRINIFNQDVTVFGLKMVVDSTILEKLIAAHAAPRAILNVEVPQAYVSGVKWSGLSKETKLDCKKVAFYHPKIIVTILQNGSRKKPKAFEQEAMLQRVSAKQILIEDPQLTLRGQDSNTQYIVQTKGGKITAEDWATYPHKPYDSTRFFGAASANIELLNAQYSFTNNLYRYTFDKLSFNTKTNNASIGGLDIRPLMSQEDFYEIVGYRRDMYTCHTPQVSFYGLDWKSLILRQTFFVGQITFSEPDFSVFYSKRPPLNPALGALPPYPAQRLQEVPFALNIPVLNISNGTVRYGESNLKTGAHGTLEFNYLNGSFYNLTNRKELIDNIPICRAVLHGKFMHQAALGAVFDFVLNSPKGAFSVNGIVKDLQASQIREQVSALATVELKSLKVSQAIIRIAGNTDSTHGRFSIPYNNLKLILKKWDANDSDVHSMLLLSFLANKLLIYPDNPMPDDTLRLARTSIIRGQTRSFFQIIWKNIFQACIQSAVRNDG
ncbi:MAG: hypothetical protein ABI169_14265, partial [Chitinophagaceae bacterium]